MRAALANRPPILAPVPQQNNIATVANISSNDGLISHPSNIPLSPSTPAPLSVPALAALESSARAHLASLSSEREAHLLLALRFLCAAQCGVERAEHRCSEMAMERSRAEFALIEAETQCSSMQESTHRVEETRRFLVNRVKCAQW
jgi:hypothetical protein